LEKADEPPVSDQLPPPPAFGAPLPLGPHPEVLAFLAQRRSASAVTLAAPGPDEAQLRDLIRLAARAPDHGKLHPWRFVVFRGEGKRAFAAALEKVARDRGDDSLAGKLVKLTTPPVCIAVISSPTAGKIPEWEQLLSAGAVCTNLTYAALAMGFGANWITDWYAYDPDAARVLGLAPTERVAGYIMIGTAGEAPLERERPDPAELIVDWKG
jgi:nitroreductase